MKKLIYIDAFMRPGSRTKRIAEEIINNLPQRYEIETVYLADAGYPIVHDCILQERTNGIVPPEHAALAGRIAAADRGVVAAQNLDYSSPEDIENKVHEAITEGLRLCEKF